MHARAAVALVLLNAIATIIQNAQTKHPCAIADVKVRSSHQLNKKTTKTAADISEVNGSGHRLCIATCVAMRRIQDAPVYTAVSVQRVSTQ